MKKHVILIVALLAITFGVSAADPMSAFSASIVEEYNATSFQNSFIGTGKGGVAEVESFLENHYKESLGFQELWGFEIIQEEMESAISDNLNMYLEDPSLTGLLFLGLMGGLEDGIQILEDFAVTLPDEEGHAPFEITDFDLGLQMRTSADYSTLYATVSLSLEYALRNWDAGDALVHFNGGSAVASIHGVIDFVSEDISFSVEGSSKDLYVIDTPQGGMKISTVSVFSEKGNYDTTMNFDTPIPLFYMAYTNDGNEAFSGNLVLTGGPIDQSLLELLSEE